MCVFVPDRVRVRTGNAIGDEGARALADVMEDTSLIEVDLLGNIARCVQFAFYGEGLNLYMLLWLCGYGSAVDNDIGMAGVCALENVLPRTQLRRLDIIPGTCVCMCARDV